MISEYGAMPVDILLVEDNPGDQRLIGYALDRASVNHDLHTVADGEAAMAFLRREFPYPDAVRPDIVLLDLNLPRKSGLSVLQDIKSTPGLQRIPVIVLTSSSNEDDVADCYDSHVNCYITKPMEMGRFVEIVEQIKQHWLTTVRLPPG